VKDEDPLAELMQDCPVCGGDGADGRCENCSGKGWT